MKFKKSAIPEPSKGVDYRKVKDEVVPDQGMSLKEILERYTRGEALPVGHDTQYGDSPDDDNPLDVDVEKIATMDLTEKDEFKKEMQQTVDLYESQQRQRDALEKIEKQKADEKAFNRKVNAEVRKRTKGSTEKLA